MTVQILDEKGKAMHETTFEKGQRIRLGSTWHEYKGQIVRVVERGMTRGGEFYLPSGERQFTSEYGAEVVEMQSIVIYAWRTASESGGFDWSSDTPENRQSLIEAARADEALLISGTVVVLSIPQWGGPGVQATEFIDGELQDSIETGKVGKILYRYDHVQILDGAS